MQPVLLLEELSCICHNIMIDILALVARQQAMLHACCKMLYSTKSSQFYLYSMAANHNKSYLMKL